MLVELGLSPNEAKIYETLVQEGEISIATIALKGQINRRNVYDALNRLVEKGLVFPVFTKGENFYNAVDPVKLIEFVKAKEEKFLRALPGLRQVYATKPKNNELYVYKGPEGYKNHLRDILRLKEDVFFIGDQGNYLDAKIKTFTDSFWQEAGRTNMLFNRLLDAQLIQKYQLLPKIAGKYKFLPAKNSSPGTCVIFGDYVVNLSQTNLCAIDEKITIYVLRDYNLANSYRYWFQFMWDSLPGNEEEIVVKKSLT